MSNHVQTCQTSWNQLNWLNLLNQHKLIKPQKPIEELSTVYYIFDTVSVSTRNSINFLFFMNLFLLHLSTPEAEQWLILLELIKDQF